MEKYWNIFCHRDTLNCVLESKCIPCLYKIFPAGIKDTDILERDIGAQFPPNQRPEMCPRANIGSRRLGLHCGLYSKNNRVLTLGDGDFSFSLALSTVLGKNITATSYEPLESVSVTYPTGERNIQSLKANHVLVLHQVDASNLSQCSELENCLFDVIVWNFPCVGVPTAMGADGQVTHLEENIDMLRRFFSNISPYIDIEGKGEVHLTHKTVEPFSWWNITEIAETCGFDWLGSVVFDRYLYPGYVNRKALDKKSFPFNDARTYIFRRKQMLISSLSSSSSSSAAAAAAAVTSSSPSSSFDDSTLITHPHLSLLGESALWSQLRSCAQDLMRVSGAKTKTNAKTKQDDTYRSQKRRKDGI